MRQTFILFSAFMLAITTSCAKSVNLTIDGVVWSSQTSLYLIINEDTANARIVPVTDGRFSVSVKVDSHAFVRLHDSKSRPESSYAVLIPDSRHISFNVEDGTIEGSPLSQKLHEAIRQVRLASPEGFHIDVFSDNEEAWAEARETEKSVRASMEENQRKIILKLIDDNKDNIIPAWIAYCYSKNFHGGIDEMTKGAKYKWLKHPILNRQTTKK